MEATRNISTTSINTAAWEEYPLEYEDPITFELMDDPVTDTCGGAMCGGHTFDRKSITSYLKDKPYCPFSGKPISSEDLNTNVRVQDLIAKWKREHAAPPPKKSLLANAAISCSVILTCSSKTELINGIQENGQVSFKSMEAFIYDAGPAELMALIAKVIAARKIEIGTFREDMHQSLKLKITPSVMNKLICATYAVEQRILFRKNHERNVALNQQLLDLNKTVKDQAAKLELLEKQIRPSQPLSTSQTQQTTSSNSNSSMESFEVTVTVKGTTPNGQDLAESIKSTFLNFSSQLNGESATKDNSNL